MEYFFQYRREQRVDFCVIADSEDQAMEQAEGMIDSFCLSSKDDESDDKGQLDYLGEIA